MSTEAQEERAKAVAGAPSHAGEPVTFRGLAGVAAARRVLNLLLTLEDVALVFEKETKAIVILQVHADPNDVWSAGDKVIDYDECTAIKELLDRAEDEWNRE